mmetsp:Transcript_1336/g.2604  ORF Transcript_1336/g.2604 Transcript_1336/m.2604 type:complete len:223 (-) Transcript_1336:34-702(-)
MPRTCRWRRHRSMPLWIREPWTQSTLPGRKSFEIRSRRWDGSRPRAGALCPSAGSLGRTTCWANSITYFGRMSTMGVLHLLPMARQRLIWGPSFILGRGRPYNMTDVMSLHGGSFELVLISIICSNAVGEALCLLVGVSKRWLARNEMMAVCRLVDCLQFFSNSVHFKVALQTCNTVRTSCNNRGWEIMLYIFPHPCYSCVGLTLGSGPGLPISDGHKSKIR